MRMHQDFPQGVRLHTDVVDLVPTMRWLTKTLQHESWEPDTFAILNTLVDPDTVMLDIGAWIGVLSVFCAKRAKRVVAYEPDPQAFEVLTANVALNACHNVTCTPTAISDSDGFVFLAGNPADGRFGCSTSQIRPSRDATTTGVQVPSLRLDDAVDRLRLSDGERLFIKMDIEGGECFAIPAAHKVWERRPKPVLLLSLHGKLVPRPEMTPGVVTHLTTCYGSDLVRIVTWDAEARRLRLLPLIRPVAGDSMESLLFAPLDDLERAAHAP